jgi:AcrR family transcriptional regulator
MTLYHYVPSKDALLDAMVEAVVGGFDLPAAASDWKAALRASAISAHERLRRHPWACAQMAMPARSSVARLDWMEAVLGCLRQAGFSAVMTHHAYHVLDSHIVGFTLWEAGYAGIVGSLEDVATPFLADLPPGRYASLVEHVGVHLSGAADADGDEFSFGLDLLLDGLERLRDRA